MLKCHTIEVPYLKRNVECFVGRVFTDFQKEERRFSRPFVCIHFRFLLDSKYYQVGPIVHFVDLGYFWRNLEKISN